MEIEYNPKVKTKVGEKLGWLGKKLYTIGIDNKLFIKRFENGAKIRKKLQGELVLNNHDLSEIAFRFKDLAGLYTSYDFDTITYKYPKTKNFIEDLKKNKVTYEEAEKIREGYKTKVKIVEALERGNK